MSESYRQLLDATIQHLEGMKARGVRNVAVVPETLRSLTLPAGKISTANFKSQVQPATPVAIAPKAFTPSLRVVPAVAPRKSEILNPQLEIISSSPEKAAAFTALRARVLVCEKCSNLVASRSTVVFGVGNIDSPLMFVGEAPGADEDLQGEPFVGAAGQLLTRIITATGLSRADVYIANILKCRPDTPGESSGNRKPTPAEMTTCLPYLHEQIDLIRPKVIVALGATAVEGLLGKTVGITKLRGHWQEYRGTPLMPTYHPAYLLRNQAMSTKREVWEDLLAVMEKLGMPITEKQRNFFFEGVKTRWKILVGLAAVLVITVLISVVHHFRLKSALEHYKAELKASGEPMELAEVIPPRIPPEKNSAAQFLAATEKFATNENVLTTNYPLSMMGVVPGKAKIAWQQADIHDYGLTNSWRELEVALKENAEAFRRLVAMTNSPQFDFGLQYEQRFEMRITNLVAEKKAVQKLSAKTVNDLRLGQSGVAAANIQVMLGIVSGTGDERTAISQLVRIAIAQIACAATWEFLQSTNVTEGELAGLQADWSRPEFIQAMAKVLPVEREGAETMVGKWRSSLKELQRYAELSKTVSKSLGHESEEESPFEKADKYRQIFLWRYWWSYADELRYLKGLQVLADTVRQISTNGIYQAALENQNAELQRLGIFKLNSSLDSLFTGKTDYHSMISESVGTLASLPRKVMRVEMAKQAAITAIALKRYQLKHGNYPADLNSLAPEFLPSVPLDPVDGQPLRYRLNPDGTFLLYSIGENGKDDGGDPSLEKGVESASFGWQNSHALDWVWPQPATEAEIQKYYAEQAKKSN